MYILSTDNLHTDFNPIKTGFRGKHRDAGRCDFTEPSPDEEDEDRGSPCPEDGEFFDARPDEADTEKAISMFLDGLEGQEETCFQQLHGAWQAACTGD